MPNQIGLLGQAVRLQASLQDRVEDRVVGVALEFALGRYGSDHVIILALAIGDPDRNPIGFRRRRPLPLIPRGIIQLEGDPLFGLDERQPGDINVPGEAQIDVAVGQHREVGIPQVRERGLRRDLQLVGGLDEVRAL
jgi:hypothetical protein